MEEHRMTVVCQSFFGLGCTERYEYGCADGVKGVLPIILTRLEPR